MHKHRKGSCINFFKKEIWVNDLRLALVGKFGLGPFWTLVQILSHVHVLQLTVSSFVSFQHGRIAIVGKIYRRCICKI
jgi:hypothetical protein